MRKEEKTIQPKKVISAILIFLIVLQVFTFPSKAEESTDGIVLETKATSLNAGDTISITISTTGRAITGMDATLNYDKTIFEELTEDDIECISTWEVQSFTSEYIILANKSGEFDTGLIATINLTVKQSATTTTFTLEETYIALEDKTSPCIGEVSCIIPIEVIEQSTLTVNPNGGIWQGSSASQTFTQDEQTTMQVPNPTSTPNGNRISFNANGGTVTSLQIIQTTSFSGWTGATLNGTTYTFGTTDATITANYTGDSITLPTATKIGTTLLGWYDQDGNYIGNAGEVYTPAYTTPNATITLTAIYEEETYTLTIDPNSGTYIGSTTLQGTYNSEVTVNNPTKTGHTVTLDNNDGTATTSLVQTYTFDGWTCSAGTINGTTYTFGASDATITANYTPNAVELPTPEKEGYTFKGWYTAATGGTKITSPYTPISDVTLYAQWTANIYTITFNPGEDATVNPTSKAVTYGEAYGTLPIPVKPGHTFKEWKDSNGKTVTESDIVNITQDITLSAVWEGTEYIITFNPDGGEIDITNKKVINGDLYGSLPLPTKPGYTFEGWLNSNGDEIVSTTTVNLTEDETLTAKWEAIKYTITFNPGEGGDVEEEEREVIYGQAVGTLPIPTRPGYIFTGWYDENGNKVDENQIIDESTNTTLTAGWAGSEYKLTFDYDGGTGDIADKTIKNGETYGELPEATKEGYTFLGWYDANGNKVESTNVISTASDITIHAKYEVKTYIVTFINDDGTEIKSIKVIHGTDAEFTGDLPEKPGVAAGYQATFTGWDNAEDMKNVTKDVTVKATYEVSPIVYTITYYNVKDADNSSNPTTYTVEDEDFDLVNLLDQGKYLFKGWYTSNESNAEKVTSIDTSKLGNIVLYAQWENDELYFKSEKYKVGENDIDIYEESDIYLDKIEPETTVSELIDNCDTNGIITIINEDGEILEEDDLVGTNMTIKVTKDDEEITMTTIVMGDLDGDGKVTATDLSALNQAILHKKDPEEVRFKAADLDDNKKLTATDLSTINNTILGTIELTYSKDQAIITSL